MMAIANPFDFSGKSVLLTGAAGGLGRPLVRAFAQAGADLAVCDMNEKALAEIEEEAGRAGCRVVTAKVDLCSEKEVAEFVRLVSDRFQKIDVLVNLTGGLIRKPSIDYTLAEWQHVIDINLKSCWICCQAVGKVMIRQKRGRIVNYSSNAGLHGFVGYPAYSPAKAGVIALTKALAIEWGPFGGCTNAVAPGFTRTPLNAEVLADPKRRERVLGRMPMGEVPPDDATVGPTLFLASEAAHWVNGHTLNVDSGFDAT
ncbi:MAG: SDR family oxidoreductase [Deltaproteobacteria bacterium]|nr:SDR family oxidoreductase [Deltaproteobacteria bacterium]